MIEERQTGRRYRPNIESDVYIKDWNTFKDSWKPTDFIKKWSDLQVEDLISQIHLCFDQLLEDGKKLCYLFPDSLRDQYQDQMIKILMSPKYFQYLDWEHQALFLGKKKQFLIYKKRSSAVPYLAKYRPPENYKKKFQVIQELSAQYQKLIIQRNLAISHQANEQIQQCTSNLQVFKKNKWSSAMKEYKKIVVDMMKDFKKQEKKLQIPLIGISSILQNEIKAIADEQQLFISNRYTNISEQEQYKDIVITKDNREYSNPSFDDDDSFDNNLSDSDQTDSIQQSKEKEEVKEPPKDIDNFIISSFASEGSICQINIFSFGTKRPTQKLEVTQFHPQITEKQKNFIIQIPVSPEKLQYQTVLPVLNSGLTTYSVRAVSQHGKSRAKLVKVWIQADTSQQPYKIGGKDRATYLLGENENGLIPYWGEQEGIIVKSTQQKWEKLKIGCCDFSVSSYTAICNSKGQVAGWGKMYYYNDGEPTNIHEEKTVEQNAEVIQSQQGLIKFNDSQEEKAVNQIGFFSPAPSFRLETPSLVLDNKFIRKVSCGEGYCLMADCFGKAWSFGINTIGQLGLQYYGDDRDNSEPTLIPHFQTNQIFVVDVVASSYGASFALTDNGVVYRWGADQIERTQYPVQDNFNSVINYQYYGIKAAQPTPIKISKHILSEPVVSIHPGDDFVLFLTASRSLYGCGKCSMLGKGTMKDANSNQIYYVCNPFEIMKDVNMVSVGKQHCLVLKDDSTIVGWGNSKNYRKNGSKFIDYPEIVKQNFKGDFICGPDFSVFNGSEKEIEVIGREDIFKKGKYELPCVGRKIKAGQGVIMMME